MTISFDQVPTALRVPFVTAEFNSTRASQGPALLRYKALLIGQKTSAGTATANTVHLVTSAEAVQTLAGRGSMLHRQAKAWFAGNKLTPCYIGVLDDNGAGVAASGKIVFAGTATADGTVSLYVGGALVSVAVSSGDTAAEVATALVAEMPDASDHILLADVDGSVPEEVDFTCRHKGTVGNDVDLRLNYQTGEALPAGITATITDMASGATNPALATLITALGDNWYQIWATGYTDATSLTSLENELADRWGPERMIDGHCFTAKNDSLANLVTLGDGRNSKHVSIFAVDESPTPAFEYAAHCAAVIAKYGQQDPARPLHTLPLTWVKAPADADQFTMSERNSLLYDGISTTKVAGGGVVQLEGVITTYQTNAADADDEAYLYYCTLANLMYLRYDWRTLIATKYPRHKLADDDTRIGAGQAVVTPKLMKAQAALWFRSMEKLGLVEGYDQFMEDLVCERNEANPNRLDILLSPDLVNQLVLTATSIQFVI